MVVDGGWGRRMRKSVSMCELRVRRASRGEVWWRGMKSDVMLLRRWVGCWVGVAAGDAAPLLLSLSVDVVASSWTTSE